MSSGHWQFHPPVLPSLSSLPPPSPPLSQGKIMDMASSKDKEAKGKKGKKDPMQYVMAGEETDTAEAELVALLANQVVKEEKKRGKPNLKYRKKGKQPKKISESTVSPAT